MTGCEISRHPVFASGSLFQIENILTMSTASESVFARLQITGKDRAKFLHNFCTNNIKVLTSGMACEAFFTDVKARILAHGYVLAFESSHEIWMLRGDAPFLAKHLSRYVITEDVTVTELDPLYCVVVFRETTELLASPLFQELAASIEDATCGHAKFSRADEGLTFFRFSWSSERLMAVAGPMEQISDLRAKTPSLAQVTAEELESLRIRERFPVIGRDMTSDHMAPEAERNNIAISYTKGCYLGQEPIARLDAMGHVNRSLRVIEFPEVISPQDVIGRPLLTADNTVAGTLTSAAPCKSRTTIGLSVIKVSAVSQPVFCELSSGVKLSGHCRPL